MPIGGDHAVLARGQHFVDLARSRFERDLIRLRNDVGLIEWKWDSVEDECRFIPGCHVDADDVLLKDFGAGCGNEALDAAAIEFCGVGGSEARNHHDAYCSNREKRDVREMAGLETTAGR